MPHFCRNPTDVASRSQIVRELLAEKQTLIILDNAQNSQQIRPSLPLTGRCAVMITTRHQNLAIARGIHRLTLTGFEQARKEALHLFTQILGTTNSPYLMGDR